MEYFEKSQETNGRYNTRESSILELSDLQYGHSQKYLRGNKWFAVNPGPL